MKFISGIHNLRKQPHGCVLAIGNFDGVHRGHQALLTRLSEEGRRRQLPVMVMLFEPQPPEMFFGTSAPARLTRLREKLHYLACTGVDSVLCIRFNQAFAACSAERFIIELLVAKLGVRFLMTGDDFRFGSERRGDLRQLQQAGEKYGFEAISTETFCANGTRISSTAVREALASDNLALAATLLGRPFTLCGRVVHGDALGRTIGFPTANVPLHRTVLPVGGVYAVEVHGLANTPLPGVANIGTRPTLGGQRQQLEVHLFDVKMDLYGQYINTELKSKIRNERRFESFGALVQQIGKDAKAAREFFGLKTPE